MRQSLVSQAGVSLYLRRKLPAGTIFRTPFFDSRRHSAGSLRNSRSCPFSASGGSRRRRQGPPVPAAANPKCSSQNPHQRIDHKGHDPRHAALHQHHAHGFQGGVELPADGGHRRDAGGIEQGEYQKADGGPAGEQSGEGGAAQQSQYKWPCGLEVLSNRSGPSGISSRAISLACSISFKLRYTVPRAMPGIFSLAMAKISSAVRCLGLCCKISKIKARWRVMAGSFLYGMSCKKIYKIRHGKISLP